MKKINLIVLGVSLLGLAACTSSGGKKTEWSEAEKILLQTYAYGEAVPFIYIEGNKALAYDEDYQCLTLTGGTATAQQLADYATLVDSYGYTGGYDEDNLYYSYEIDVSVDAGTRYVNLDFYCLDSEGDFATSGTFELDIYDPYYYAWDDMPVDDLVGLFDATSTSTVPSFTANRYSLSTAYMLFGYDFFSISALDQTSIACETTYKNALEAAHWTVTYVEDATDGNFYNAYSSAKDLQIQFYYEDNALVIDVIGYVKTVA